MMKIHEAEVEARRKQIQETMNESKELLDRQQNMSLKDIQVQLIIHFCKLRLSVIIRQGCSQLQLGV